MANLVKWWRVQSIVIVLSTGILIGLMILFHSNFLFNVRTKRININRPFFDVLYFEFLYRICHCLQIPIMQPKRLLNIMLIFFRDYQGRLKPGKGISTQKMAGTFWCWKRKRQNAWIIRGFLESARWNDSIGINASNQTSLFKAGR